MRDLTDEEIAGWKREIDQMTQEECAILYRFAPIGHPLFRRELPLYPYFEAHFEKLGGMTPEISRKIGWR